MELRHYRYFLAAAEELNISRASRRLNVSQPAMSRLIRDLEDELGAPLFKRERFGLALTPAGETLLSYARQIIDLSN
ncbi:MAG: LysR family transcriptional regulator, partial [Geobacteraceae bacterium]|nr:LysR family transcriptional regulator [Geobacteraceae bacterium]